MATEAQSGENYADKFVQRYARELLQAGKINEALHYIDAFIDKRDTAAMIARADYEYEFGSKEASDAWMAKVEQLAEDGNLDALVDLISAYQLGLGSGDHANRERKELMALERLANAGNLVAAHSLMSRYLHGLNGAEVSPEKFEHWARKAVENGSETAAKALSRMDQWPNVAPEDD